jgi:hypothetical protein
LLASVFEVLVGLVGVKSSVAFSRSRPTSVVAVGLELPVEEGVAAAGGSARRSE